jgi:DNA adenine methylase
MSVHLAAPFPYFGGKRQVAPLIWQALGDVGVYVEPFFGSGSIMLARPTPPKIETVNDADGYLTNFWRAVQADARAVAQWADYPVSELDLHARHRYLMAQEDFREHMRRDPYYYDAQLAGWWVWGLCTWIGHGWCQTADARKPMTSGNTPGRGLHRKRPVVSGDREGQGLWQVRPHLSSAQGLQCATSVPEILVALATRLRRTRICCGDWQRVCTPVVLGGAGATGIVLDPPYSHQERDGRLYSTDTDCAAAVASWAIGASQNPQYRIVLCGYDGEHAMPPTWQKLAWQANGGYGNQGNGRGRANKQREVLWCSPACLTVRAQLPLFATEETYG